MKKETEEKRTNRRCIQMYLPMTNMLKELFIDATKVYDHGLYYYRQEVIGVPFDQFRKLLEYRAKDAGIDFLETEESFTSKTDHLAKESTERHEENLGSRETRGLFRSSTGKLVHADINGAIGIMMKKHILSDKDLDEFRKRKDISSPIVVKTIRGKDGKTRTIETK